MDFVEWLALYKIRLSLDEKCGQVIACQPVVLQIKANLELDHTWRQAWSSLVGLVERKRR